MVPVDPVPVPIPVLPPAAAPHGETDTIGE